MTKKIGKCQTCQLCTKNKQPEIIAISSSWKEKKKSSMPAVKLWFLRSWNNMTSLHTDGVACVSSCRLHYIRRGILYANVKNSTNKKISNSWKRTWVGTYVKMLLSSFDIRSYGRRNVGLLTTIALHNVFTSVNGLNETLICWNFYLATELLTKLCALNCLFKNLYW